MAFSDFLYNQRYMKLGKVSLELGTLATGQVFIANLIIRWILADTAVISV